MRPKAKIKNRKKEECCLVHSFMEGQTNFFATKQAKVADFASQVKELLFALELVIERKQTRKGIRCFKTDFTSRKHSQNKF